MINCVTLCCNTATISENRLANLVYNNLDILKQLLKHIKYWFHRITEKFLGVTNYHQSTKIIKKYDFSLKVEEKWQLNLYSVKKNFASNFSICSN
jgi:hypothetical protein